MSVPPRNFITYSNSNRPQTAYFLVFITTIMTFKRFISLCSFVCIALVCSVLPVSAQVRDSLRFKQFLQAVMKAHPVVQSAALENKIADNEIQSALGSFDPMIRAGYDTKVEASKSKYDDLYADVEVPLATLFGPKILAGYSRAIGGSINPEISTGNAGNVLLGLSAPLWQGVLTDRRRTALDKARLRPTLATANQRFEQNNLLRAAAFQYWSWAEAAEQLDIADSVFKISVQRVRFITARSRRGEISPLDTVEALQELERRRGDIFRSQRVLEQAGIDAAVFLWTDAGTAQTLAQPPASLPKEPPLDSLSIRADRERAMTLRPEMLRLDVNAQSLTLDMNLAREAQKPFIETKAQWFYGIDKGTADNFKLGVNLGLPLFFRTANAQTELLSVSIERLRLQTLQVSRFINADIDNALSALGRAAERIQAAEKELGYAMRMADGEQRRFREGETSLLIVNLRERAAAEAASRVVSARADYLRAWTQYYWAIGAIQQLAE
ncbi:MAG: TolC family protein [Candidatus Kapaibacterium sp.]|nr:MAG: TolC family protein [Candidatus Kapabacteria bacterium]